MPQFGLLLMLVVLPLQMLSGGSTPRESMPEVGADRHAGRADHAFRHAGARPSSIAAPGLGVVWPKFAALAVIGSVLFAYTLARFRATIGSMA